MTVSSMKGPFSVTGQPPVITGTGGLGAVPQMQDTPNSDLAPSLMWGGLGIRDPRWYPRIGEGSLSVGGYPNQDVGWYLSAGGLVVCDQVPATASTSNLAAAQAATSGTGLTLAAASVAGVTLLSAALSLALPLGATIPSGALGIDLSAGYIADTTPPNYVGGGPSGAFQFFDPTAGVARAVSVTAAAGATGGVVKVSGYDVYGQAMTENITSVAASTVNGKKAFKFVVSAVAQFTDATHNYSLGTTDIFGFNVLAAKFGYSGIYFNSTLITASTGFVAPDTTSPATSSTGDVRGTYATQSASDSVKQLQMFVMPSVANMVAANFTAAQNGLVGITQA